MARKLKTYQTSLGFFDLAIAAPSMKAALEAWGANSNLFHQGVARESDDADIVAATMAKPGIILRRPVGSKQPFTDHAELPADLGGRPEKRRTRPRKQPPRRIDDKAARKASLAFERVQKQRESERRKQEAAEAKLRERRERAAAKSQAALEKAAREHEKRAGSIEAERAALEKRWEAEEARWRKQKEKLQAALRRAQ